jgi:3-methylcrotonyl-CoA carboxylase alpha subunit
MLRSALDQYQVVGPSTNVDFLRVVAAHPKFAAGPVETNFIPEHHDELFPAKVVPAEILAQAALSIAHHEPKAGVSGAWASLPGRRFSDESIHNYHFDEGDVQVSQRPEGGYDMTVTSGTAAPVTLKATAKRTGEHELVTQFTNSHDTATVIPHGPKLHVFTPTSQYTLRRRGAEVDGEEGGAGPSSDVLASPMPATVIDVRVQPGDTVTEGQVCAVLESMKMEINIRAGRDGVIAAVNVAKGQAVEEGASLVALEPESAESK